jgi:hypothetical protein
MDQLIVPHVHSDDFGSETIDARLKPRLGAVVSTATGNRSNLQISSHDNPGGKFDNRNIYSASFSLGRSRTTPPPLFEQDRR